MSHNFSRHNSNIAKHFDELCLQFGDTHQSSGWFSEHTQNSRFLVSTFIDDLNGAKILDIGCGCGAFFGYLINNDIEVEYHGLDISKEMIELAQAQYPNNNFIHADFLDPTWNKNDEKFDYVFASGPFNLKLEHQDIYIKENIQKMFNLCKKGISLNLLSAHAPKKMMYPNTFFYYDPVIILQYCLTLTRYVTLSQHYLPNDFTINLYKPEK
jgi:ubiquinone/menaquinone biosynthesis C-methylase UbiE